MIGEDDDLSILAHKWAWRIDAPMFELADREWSVTYWTRIVPTPQHAAELLEEHGGLPEEERGNPYRQDDE